MRKRFWRIAGWSALTLLAVLAFCGYRIVWGKPFTINQLANRQVLEFLMRNPELFTEVGIADGSILDRHSGKLAPYTIQQRDAGYAQFESFLREVHWFDRAGLARQDQITYDILIDQYQSGLAPRRFPWLPADLSTYAISPMSGAQVQLTNFMETLHIVNNEKTARNYVARLETMGGKLDEITAEMRRQSRAGVILPPMLIERSLTVIHDTIAPAATENPLVTTFVARMSRVKSLDPTRQHALEQQAAAAVRAGVYPAYERMRAALVALEPAAAGQAAGVGRLPDGAAYYATVLRQQTTTDYTPEQIHALGLSEVARISAGMDTLLRTQGLAAGSVGERMAALGKDPRFLFPNDDDGRRQALARFRQILDEVSARMPEYFRTQPAGRLTVTRVSRATISRSPLRTG